MIILGKLKVGSHGGKGIRQPFVRSVMFPGSRSQDGGVLHLYSLQDSTAASRLKLQAGRATA